MIRIYTDNFKTVPGILKLAEWNLIVVMILVLSFENIRATTNDSYTSREALFCYGTVVGFSIILSGDILKKLFLDKKRATDKMEIFYNVLAVILFAVVGFIRAVKYKFLNELAREYLDDDLSAYITGVKTYLAGGVLAIIIAIAFLVELLWRVWERLTGDPFD